MWDLYNVYNAIYTDTFASLFLFFFTNIIIVRKKLLDEENGIKLRQSRVEQTTSITNLVKPKTKDGRSNITAIRRELTIIQDKLLKRSIRNTISPIPHMPSWTQLCKRGILYSTSCWQYWQVARVIVIRGAKASIRFASGKVFLANSIH